MAEGSAVKGGGETFSVSKVLCRASVSRGGESTMAFFRHLAPLTVNAILRALPMDCRANVQSNVMVCLFTSVRVGVEKPRARFGRGDVAFLPSGALVCIFIKDVQSDKPLNPIGKVEVGEDLFDRVRSGDVVRLALLP